MHEKSAATADFAPLRRAEARTSFGGSKAKALHWSVDLFAPNSAQGAHNIVSDIKLIPIDDVNAAFEVLHEGKADFRYVIDMATLKGKKEDDSIAAKFDL